MNFLDQASAEINKRVAIELGYSVQAIAAGDFRLFRPNNAQAYPHIKGETPALVWEQAFKIYLPRFSENKQGLAKIVKNYALTRVIRGNQYVFQVKLHWEGEFRIGQGTSEALALCAAFLSPRGEIFDESKPFTESDFAFLISRIEENKE